jgi:hypothetical protein
MTMIRVSMIAVCASLVTYAGSVTLVLAQELGQPISAEESLGPLTRARFGWEVGGFFSTPLEASFIALLAGTGAYADKRIMVVGVLDMSATGPRLFFSREAFEHVLTEYSLRLVFDAAGKLRESRRFHGKYVRVVATFEPRPRLETLGIGSGELRHVTQLLVDERKRDRRLEGAQPAQ